MRLATKQIAVSVILCLSGVVFSAEAANIFEDQNRTDGKTGGGIVTARSFILSYTVQIVSYNSNIVIETSSDVLETIIDALPADTYVLNYLDSDGFVVYSIEYTK